MSDGDSRRSGGRRRSPEETRQEILEAARRFLWDHSFRELSIGDLMEGTSVGRSSFYIHFKDRFDLASSLLDLVDGEVSVATAGVRTDDLEPRALGEDLGRLVGVWERHGPVVRAISEAAAQDERLEHLYRSVFLQRGIGRITAAIASAQQGGRVASDLDPGETGVLLILMTERYLCDRLGRLPQGDPAVQRKHLVWAWQRILEAGGYGSESRRESLRDDQPAGPHHSHMDTSMRRPPDDPEQRRRRRSPEETRQEILEAARRFLWDHSFRQLSIGDLMAGTSVGRSAYYIHFKDRYELASALLDLVDDELKQATALVGGDPVLSGTLEKDLEGVVGVWHREGPVVRAISEASAQDERLEHLYRWVFLQRIIDRVADVIASAQAVGRVAADIDPSEVSALLILMNERYLCDRFGRLPQADPDLPRQHLIRAWRRILDP